MDTTMSTTVDAGIVEIDVSSEELTAGKLNPSKLEAALSALKTDGVVVLKDIVSPASIAALKERTLIDLEALLNRKDAPFNWTKGNVQQDPPRSSPYLFRDVLVNDIVISVTKGILGSGMRNGFYSGNTALPSESRQPVHADIGQLWPNLESVPPPAQLVVNIPLVDMGPENGSTEIWPGTHLDPEITIQGGDIEVSDERLAEQSQISPPIQPRVKAGSVVIRDMRLWHAGMPNRTNEPRPMIAMIHSVNWWPAETVQFPKGTEEFLTHPDLQWNVEFVDGEIDHIATPHGYKEPTDS